MNKYKKVVGYWVYTIYIPSIAKYYIGYSKLQCCDRWRKGCYKKNNSLGKYLDEWDNMVKTVVKDNLTKEQAVTLEDELILKYKEQGICINEVRSGWIKKKDKNAYNREWEKKNKIKKKLQAEITKLKTQLNEKNIDAGTY